MEYGFIAFAFFWIDCFKQNLISHLIQLPIIYAARQKPILFIPFFNIFIGKRSKKNRIKLRQIKCIYIMRFLLHWRLTTQGASLSNTTVSLIHIISFQFYIYKGKAEIIQSCINIITYSIYCQPKSCKTQKTHLYLQGCFAFWWSVRNQVRTLRLCLI